MDIALEFDPSPSVRATLLPRIFSEDGSKFS
jgi:hypothetical protein